MNKDFNKDKLLSFSPHKQLKILYDLALFIEKENKKIDSKAWEKLQKYHTFLQDSQISEVQKVRAEFKKVTQKDFQYQVYLMSLERLLDQTSKEYDFLIEKKDKSRTQKNFPIICILDSVRSAHNVGAMIRNAECFGAQEVICTGLSPNPDSVQVQKTAMGCDKLVQCKYVKDVQEVIDELKSAGYKVWAIETVKEQELLNEILEVPTKLAVIFGHEQFGITQQTLARCEKIISISLFGEKNSLNVSVSQGIVLNHLTKRMK